MFAQMHLQKKGYWDHSEPESGINVCFILLITNFKRWENPSINKFGNKIIYLYVCRLNINGTLPGDLLL